MPGIFTHVAVRFLRGFTRGLRQILARIAQLLARAVERDARFLTQLIQFSSGVSARFFNSARKCSDEVSFDM